MQSENARTYFEKLTGLLAGTQATDRDGQACDLDRALDNATRAIIESSAEDRKLMMVGNGGSSAIVAHMQADLCNSLKVRAMVFHDTPTLTALSNDVHYDVAFERGIELWAQQGDLLLAISSSGQSANILNAVRTARGKGCKVITLSGFKNDNPLRSLGDINFYVASDAYGFVELSHSVLAHYVTDRIAILNPEQVVAR